MRLIKDCGYLLGCFSVELMFEVSRWGYVMNDFDSFCWDFVCSWEMGEDRERLFESWVYSGLCKLLYSLDRFMELWGDKDKLPSDFAIFYLNIFLPIFQTLTCGHRCWSYIGWSTYWEWMLLSTVYIPLFIILKTWLKC